MLKLHGFPVSNYANMVNLALLEKGIPFEYVLAFPDQNPDFLARSPRGKVPFLETPQGYLNETSVIFEYLEDTGEGKPLLPSDPYARAMARALLKEIELYIELPARTCFVEAFFGGKVPEAIKAKAREDLQAGFRDPEAARQVRAVRRGRHVHARRHRLPVQRRSRGQRREAALRPRPARRHAGRTGATEAARRESARPGHRGEEGGGHARIRRDDEREAQGRGIRRGRSRRRRARLRSAR